MNSSSCTISPLFLCSISIISWTLSSWTNPSEKMTLIGTLSWLYSCALPHVSLISWRLSKFPTELKTHIIIVGCSLLQKFEFEMRNLFCIPLIVNWAGSTGYCIRWTKVLSEVIGTLSVFRKLFGSATSGDRIWGKAFSLSLSNYSNSCVNNWNKNKWH